MPAPITPVRKKVISLVDGFNLYHSIDDYLKTDSLKWVDIVSLSRAFITPDETLCMVHFFTALPPWDGEKRERHQKLVDVYKDMGVNIVYGAFKDHTVRCGAKCKEEFVVQQEKETDVNIALHLARAAHEKKYDKILLVTGDSDQVPSVHYALSVNPGLVIKAVIPPFRRADELKTVCQQHGTISRDHFVKHRLPDPYKCRDGITILHCPTKWKDRAIVS